jgi:hypothetical protein
MPKRTHNSVNSSATGRHGDTFLAFGRRAGKTWSAWSATVSISVPVMKQVEGGLPGLLLENKGGYKTTLSTDGSLHWLPVRADRPRNTSLARNSPLEITEGRHTIITDISQRRCATIAAVADRLFDNGKMWYLVAWRSTSLSEMELSYMKKVCRGYRIDATGIRVEFALSGIAVD